MNFDEEQQTVVFKQEELLTPREIKKYFGVGVRGHGKQRLYSLDEVEELIKNGTFKKLDSKAPTNPCDTCPFKGKKPVPSSGDFRKAKVVFVGEAPGRNEEREGIPFIGQAGRVLKRTMSELGIKESDVVFTNICRCRPPGNQPPPEKVVSSCKKYLLKELEEFKGLIVLLGSTALQALLGKFGVLKIRGYGFFKEDRDYLVTYHPAYVLRNQGTEVEKNFTEDLRKVKQWMDGPKSILYETIDTPERFDTFLDRISRVTKFSFDLETTSLSPFDEDSRVLSISFSWGEGKEKNWFLPLEHSSSPFLGETSKLMKKLQPVFEDKEKKIVTQNGKFDVKWLRKKYGIIVKRLWFDTMLAHYLIEGKYAPRSLKSMVWSYDTGYGGYAISTDNLDKLPLKEVGRYNVMDSFLTYLIARKQKDKLLEAQYYLLTRILSPIQQVLAEMELSGIKLDWNTLVSRVEQTQEELKDLETRMHGYKEIEELEERNSSLVNFNSSKQLVEVFGAIGIYPAKRTKKTGSVSTDNEALKEIEGKHPVVGDLLEYRKVGKILSTYLAPYYENSKDRVVHANYLLDRTATGRLSCENPNLQNVPVDVRKVFTCKNDFLLEADYSQLELRVLTCYTKDEKFVEAFSSGADIHEATRFSMFGEETDRRKKKEQRVKAKGVNFGVVYGISEFSLAKELKCSHREARKFIDKFYATYEGVAKWVQDVKDFVKSNKYYETVFGRRRYFRYSVRDSMASKEAKLREAVNFPIQSTARDLVFDAEVRMWRVMRELGMKSEMIADTHDAVLFDVVDKELEVLVDMAKTIMENFDHFSFVNVPIKIDLSLGKVWGELEKL